MPRIKKPRKKGVTYMLVPRSYGDAGGEEGSIWVTEAEFYKNHQNPAPAEEEEKARHQFKMYAAAADAEFDDAHPRRVQNEADVAAHGIHAHVRRRLRDTEDGDGDGEDEYEEEGEYYDGDEEGEWLDGDWEEEEEDLMEAPVTRGSAAPSPALVKESAASPTLVSSRPAGSAVPAARASVVEKQEGPSQDFPVTEDPLVTGENSGDEEEEEKLFEDEVDCEVTDDFLRQLVFGGEGGSEDNGGFPAEDDDDDDGQWDVLEEEDGELWRLLTDEEKAAIKASRNRGTGRRRHVIAAAGAGEDGAHRTHAADGTEYPVHDTEERALERQFAEMMREFNADARLNDAYTDDPRTYGPLSMDKYLTALEEFVTDRAGMDMETAEPQKNKGLIQQLKYLAHHAGAFDSDAHGVYMTTTLSEKQQRFVDEFRRGTEEIRRAARLRIAQRNAAAAAGAPTPAEGENVAEEEKDDDFVVMEVKSKADRLDCETAISAYSTYYNQPNVIQAPRRRAQARRSTQATARSCPSGIKEDSLDVDGVTKAPRSPLKNGATAALTRQRTTAQPTPAHVTPSADEIEDESLDMADGAGHAVDVVPTLRRKDETKEEKKMRRQAVKEAQRLRRQEKSVLKHTYKELESAEVKRSATSQTARRTVHFM